MRPTRLEINLTAIKQNLGIVKQLTNNRKVIAVVKANGYGLGSIAVVKALMESAVSAFAVALVEEAEVLRENGVEVDKKILLLAPFMENEIEEIIDYSITPTIIDFKRANILNRCGHTNNKIIPIHIKIDTGMGRLGFRLKDFGDFLQNLSELKNLQVEGIFSHLSSADIPDIEFTNHQIALFNQLIEQSKRLFPSVIAHLSNSSGIIAFSESYFDAVRPGLMLYGCYSSAAMQSKIKLNKVTQLKTEIASIKILSPGNSVSYGRTFIAKEKTKVALLPIGYADGYSTLLSNKGQVIIGDNKVPVIGRICMDYTMIDITMIPDAEIGDEVILIGESISEEEIARQTGLIPYEVLTGISQRIPRKYILG